MQKIVIFDMFISGKNGTRERTKCSTVPSLSISIVQASSRDRINSFSPPERQGGGERSVLSFNSMNHQEDQGLAFRPETPNASGTCARKGT